MDVRRFPWVRPLAGEYAANFASVAPLYAGDPQSPDAWREVSARVRSHPGHRDHVAAAIAAQQRRRDAPEAAQTAAALLANPDTVAVVTGQQAGVFGGPLYTVLKAVSAIQLARRAAQTLGTPVVPIFWVAAEDHDWAEIASVTVLDAQLQPRTIAMPPPEGAGERPVGSLDLDERVTGTLDELAAALAPTEFTPWLLDSLRAAYRPGDRRGRCVRPLDRRTARQPRPHRVRLRRPVGQTARVGSVPPRDRHSRAHGSARHQPPAPRWPRADIHRRWCRRKTASRSSASIRRREPARRSGVKATSSWPARPRSALRISRKSSTQAPERFSPNVLLRPIVQDTLFPTICYVAGPSELAYFGQLRKVYEHFGRPMPLVHPRSSATLVDSATIRFLNKYDVPLEDLQPQDEAALNRLLQAQLPPTVDAAFSAAGQAMSEKMQDVVDAVASVDPTLAGAAKNTFGKMEHELKALQGKMIQAAKRRDDTLRRQFTRAQGQTFPQGHPQERSLAVVYFLNQYGPALVDRLLEELPIDPGQHWVVAI